MIKPYQHLQIFSGGGSRFAYYLGSYAALCATDFAPNAIVGTCGGSIAAWLVAQTPEPERLQQVIVSKAFHRTMQSVCVSRKVGYAAWFQAALREWQTRSPQRLRQVHDHDSVDFLVQHLQKYALFQSPELPENWLDEVADFAQNLPNPNPQKSPDILIAASRILPQNQHIKMQQIWFAPSQIAQFWQHNPPICHAAHHAPQRILPHAHVCVHDVPQAVAVAASIGDMYYQAPVLIENVGYALGGVLDLNPVETACDLAQTVWAEHKPRYAHAAHTAILRVFGTNAHLRHRETENHTPHNATLHRFPFADNALALRGNYAPKRWNWRAGCLNMDLGDHATFARQMQAQWDYGYTRTAAFCAAL